MQKFYDREEAKKITAGLVKKVENGKSGALWVEGIEGVGKTRFIEFLAPKFKKSFLFKYHPNMILYKCNSNSAYFEYIDKILFELKDKDPRKFESFITKYFSKNEKLSLLDICCSVFPLIKGFKTISHILKTKNRKIAALKECVSEQIIFHQLSDLFSDIIVMYLVNVYKVKSVIFCIDDIQWIDRYSLDTLNSLIEKCKTENLVSISIFITVRNRKSLSQEELNTYNDTYHMLKNHYPDMLTVMLENFNLPVISNILNDLKRYELLSYIDLLQTKTNGNPLELEYTLRLTDSQIKTDLEMDRNDLNNQNIFFTQHISNIYYEKPIYSAIINILSLLRHQVADELLFQCVLNVYVGILHNKCSYELFIKAISDLENMSCIVYDRESNVIFLKHDYIWQTVNEYLSENGKIKSYGKILAKTLLTFQNESANVRVNHLLALGLLAKVDPEHCIDQFFSLLEKEANTLDTEFYVKVAEAFCTVLLGQDMATIVKVVEIILPRLVSTSNLLIAQKLCHALFLIYNKLPSITNQINFLIQYIKVQIDLSCVNNGDESAIFLFNKLYEYECNDRNLKLEILLLGMSTYEHALKHDLILSLYTEASNLLQQGDKDISARNLSVFYRNKGLCFPHSILKSDYFKGVLYALSISDSFLRNLSVGTCLNNLGLAYFYNGEIEKAKHSFCLSKKRLGLIGYNTARVSNNIAICHYMLKEWNESLSLFIEAASKQKDGNFIRLCIQTNLAVAMYRIDKKEAKTILSNVFKELENDKAKNQDTLIYAAAKINSGYFAFKEKDYTTAAKCYKESLKHTYRYQNEEQNIKRYSMRDISLKCEINGEVDPNSTMDLNDTSMNIYKKPYSLVPFAFYVV